MLRVQIKAFPPYMELLESGVCRALKSYTSIISTAFENGFYHGHYIENSKRRTKKMKKMFVNKKFAFFRLIIVSRFFRLYFRALHIIQWFAKYIYCSYSYALKWYYIICVASRCHCVHWMFVVNAFLRVNVCSLKYILK